MTESYVLTGKIVHGKGLGRTVGMPTANLEIDKDCILPESGVYATRMKVGQQSYASVTNIGTRPSVDQGEYVTIETYILDFHADIYGEIVELEVCGFLRPIQKFENLEQVYEQVKKDVQNAKKCLDIEKSK